MRIALYLVIAVVLLPYALPATGFVLLGLAMGDGTLGSMLTSFLQIIVWLTDGGMLAVAAALLVILMLAASERWRWLGFACLFLAALASAALIAFLPELPPDPGQWLFLVPCVLAGIGSAWLSRAELRDRPATKVAVAVAPTAQGHTP